eukprot:142096_1
MATGGTSLVNSVTGPCSCCNSDTEGTSCCILEHCLVLAHKRNELFDRNIYSDETKINQTNRLLTMICGLLTLLVIFQFMKCVWTYNNYRTKREHQKGMYSFDSESESDHDEANERQQQINDAI